MTTTTIDRPEQSALLGTLWRAVLLAVVAVALIAGSFAIGRATSPTHTVHTVVAVPASTSADQPLDCHLGRAC